MIPLPHGVLEMCEKLGAFFFFETSNSEAKIHVCGQIKTSKKGMLMAWIQALQRSLKRTLAECLASVAPLETAAFCPLEKPDHRCSALGKGVVSLKYLYLSTNVGSLLGAERCPNRQEDFPFSVQWP